jgi:hypothetical protein
MHGNQTIGVPDGLREVVITSQLQSRAPRQHDLSKENAAFRELAQHLGASPGSFLDRLVEMALELCEADTAGISMEQTSEAGERIFRWVAMAGELKHLIGGTTPRNFSPCGVCVDQNRPLLMAGLDRVYTDFKQAPMPFVEALLLPWEVKGGPVGTLWIVAHDDQRKFDREDVRLMGCLAAFTAGALQLKQLLLESERAAAITEVVSEMAHQINNPLQGAMFAIYSARLLDDQGQGVRSMILLAEQELKRVATLSAALLQSKYVRNRLG